MDDGAVKNAPGKKVIDIGAEDHLPAVPNTSQAAEVVKQIIEQILANERRRARMEFIRLSVFFLVFLFVMLGTGIWFARQLLAQLREERQLTEQTWRMMAAGGGGNGSFSAVAKASPYAKPLRRDEMADKTLMPSDEADVKTPPALSREEVARLEKNINAVSDLLKSNPHDSSASIQEKLQHQQNAIQALNARLNESQGKAAGASATPEQTKKIDFISAPVAEDTRLRLPIPSL